VDLRPDILFNLVESLGGSDLLMPVPTMLLDALGIPYTGSGTEAIFATTHKLVAKERILRCGLRTPDWISQYSTHIGPPKFASGMNGKAHPGKSPRRFIIKSITEHASVGIDDTAVVEVKSTDEIRELLTVRESETGRA
jgi:D-alanine-D-alanine ligase